MLLFGLIVVVMLNFASNSVLGRTGIFVFGMDPLAFSGLRLASGAVMLAVLVTLRGQRTGQGWPPLNRARALSATTLLIYLVPFSVAYVTLPTGIGALILFGFVQVTMFAGSALAGVQPSVRQWLGMSIAMIGLGWLLWPRETLALDPVGVIFMILSGVGWGLFSLRGRGSRDPLADMAWSFVALVPIALVLMVMGSGWTAPGVLVAIVCGGVTSALGYALWYRVLPQIAATTGSVAQLSVPVIALIAGAVLLAEAITWDVIIASTVVLGGIALAVLRRQ